MYFIFNAVIKIETAVIENPLYKFVFFLLHVFMVKPEITTMIYVEKIAERKTFLRQFIF